ncbi:methylated-DNA--[protein]-cysteine S-methyltransferase [Celerinatantimonas diazotrophica]|nr:methylated-DNA--[protein]-cysteine S-methyltransferase [Celerinatantimonas diazotrophica]CAG9295172.1 Methylated-DNA--protein-cysteine methyltransferase [Celerinatantimonas diazotrophica]
MVLLLAKQIITLYHAVQKTTTKDQQSLGKRQQFSVALDISGTEFQQQVYQQLRQIPYAQTRSYKDIALALGKPGAARAVGMANNRNRLPIIIPCHRVIGRNGQLVGFASGVEIKQQLLELEQDYLPQPLSV